MSAKLYILSLLGLVAVAFSAAWWRFWRKDAARPATPSHGWPTLVHVAIGAVTNFFDTLGVGSFATTTVLFRFGRMMPDELIPGTLNVGHALPTIAQAFIFVAVVTVDPTTLVAMIASAVAGAWLGAGVVTRWPRARVQLGMGVLLLVAAVVMVARLSMDIPQGTATGLEGSRLLVGVVGNFVLGALMMLGIGLYAPCMILVSLLGMDVRLAFPIMMGACAFLAPIAGLRFVKRARYHPRVSLGLTLGGIPAVLVAGLIVERLRLDVVKWLVVVVVVYTAAVMLRSARREES